MSIFSTCNDVMNISGILESTIDTCNSIESLEEGVFKYTPSMIPVAARETSEGTKYLVEFDMLRKLSNDLNTPIVESFETVCNENDIDSNDMYVYVSEASINSVCDAIISESCTGNVMSINYEINTLMENNINILISEGVKFNPLKFDSIAEENPKLKEIRSELESLSAVANADKEVVYKKKNSVTKSILKVLRVLCSITGNISEILFIPSSVIKIGANTITKKATSSLNNVFNDIGYKPNIDLDMIKEKSGKSTLWGILLNLIVIILTKLSVYLQDKSEEIQLKADMNDIIKQLEEIKSKIDDEKEKENVDRKIDEIKKLIYKLDN